MNIINYKIRHIIIELVVAFVFLGVSIPLWNKFNNKEYRSIAKSYATSIIKDLIAVEPFNEIIKVTNINELETIKDAHYVVKNYSSIKSEYKLIFKVSKSSDISLLNININDINYKLLDLVKEEDNDYYYFYLDKNEIKSNKSKDYYLKLWIDESKCESVDFTSLKYSFILL